MRTGFRDTFPRTKRYVVRWTSLVPLAVAELFDPILHDADHRFCPGRVFERCGRDTKK